MSSNNLCLVNPGSSVKDVIMNIAGDDRRVTVDKLVHMLQSYKQSALPYEFEMVLQIVVHDNN